MSGPEYSNNSKVFDSILKLLEPLKGYMIGILNYTPSRKDPKTEANFLANYKRNDIEACRRCIERVSEIHDLSDMFLLKNRNGETFRAAYIRRYCSEQHAESDADRFVDCIRMLHRARNESAHGSIGDGGSRISELPDDKAQMYGSIMCFLSNEIGNPVINADVKLSTYLTDVFQLDTDTKNLREQVDRYVILLNEKDEEIKVLTTEKNSLSTRVSDLSFTISCQEQLLGMKDEIIRSLKEQQSKWIADGKAADGQNSIDAERSARFNAIRDMAEDGDAESQFRCGAMYLFGECTEKNGKRAFKWITDSAAQGFAPAQFALGSMYYEGFEADQSYENAFKWYSLAAEQGVMEAQHNLAIMYADGIYAEQSYEVAYIWFRKAAEQEDAASQYCLGTLYMNGRGVEQSGTEAMKWIALAAESGYPAAQYWVGMHCADGTILEQSDIEAVRWYRMAAEQGYPAAQCDLGLMYLAGRGVEKSYEEALRWISPAAEHGDREAQFLLGMMYSEGMGIEQSQEEAIRWYQMAADQGLEYAKEALNALNDDNIEGSTDRTELMNDPSALERSFNEGNAEAGTRLGILYLTGKIDGEPDLDKAKEWFEKALKAGDPEAKSKLKNVMRKIEKRK